MAVATAVLLDLPVSSGGLRGCAFFEAEARTQGCTDAWTQLLARTSTALLLKELRGTHFDDRELDVELVRELLKYSADVNAGQNSVSSLAFAIDWGEEDFTPLVLLANASQISTEAATTVVQLLLENRADVEHADDDGDTALTWAVIKNNLPVVQALASAGACLGMSLVEEEASPLAALSHPALLIPLAEALGPKIRSTLEDFPSPPLWLVVQFGTLQALKTLLGDPEDRPEVDTLAVEALLRRRLQRGGFDGGALDIFCDEDKEVAMTLRSAVAGADQADQLADEATWRQMLSDAATGLLRQEIEGAYEGTFELDLPFVRALLATGADPNLQVIGDDDLDEDADDDEDEDAEEEGVSEPDEDDEEGDDDDEEEEEDDDDDAASESNAIALVSDFPIEEPDMYTVPSDEASHNVVRPGRASNSPRSNSTSSTQAKLRL